MSNSKAHIAARKPAAVDLEPGQHHWCSCGRSASQPLCDGSHRDTPFTPLAFTVDEPGKAFLCACKQTKNPPYCDGTHATLPKDVTEMEPPSAEGPGMPKAQNTPEEPTVEWIHSLAEHGLTKDGHHGPMDSMGIPRSDLPHWDDLQLLTAQLATKPRMEDESVATGLTIGPRARRPLHLKIPLFVSDMSYGALSEEAKVSMARGAELAGTGICSGEGGMLPEEQAANTRYFYELASAKFGYDEHLLGQVQAFHFKGGQGAKTGTGGHLPGNKVVGKIAKVRGLEEGQPAVSPPTFADLSTVQDYADFANHVRELTGGVPIGFKLSAQHIERDIQFALDATADYIILDGRGGGTGAAPRLFRDNISVPTIPALARARRFLDQQGASDVTLIVTGGLRTPADFVKAMCLGADGVALANSAMQAIGCVSARMCNTNNCPAGIATQKPHLREQLNVDVASQRLARFLGSSIELMQVLARACGYLDLGSFQLSDLATWKGEMANLTGVPFAGMSQPVE